MPYQVVGLSDLIRGLFQASLSGINTSVTIIDVFLHVAHIVVIESPFGLLGRRGGLILRLQSFAVNFLAWTQILLGIGEEVMRTSADKIRATDFRIGDLELRIARRSAGTYELVRWKKNCISCCLELGRSWRWATYLP